MTTAVMRRSRRDGVAQVMERPHRRVASQDIMPNLCSGWGNVHPAVRTLRDGKLDFVICHDLHRSYAEMKKT